MFTNLLEFQQHFVQRLSPLYEIEEVYSLLYQTIAKATGVTRLDMALLKTTPADAVPSLTPSEKDQLYHMLQRLERQEPIQYIIGETSFYGLNFCVNPSTLIPRPETEELVHWIISDYKGKSPKVLDIGTGSGCIAIALASKLADAKVWACDVSTQALESAKENARSNEVSVQFEHIDILHTVELPGTFDVIVSNPPYVRALEKEKMATNVLDYEPHLALFVTDADPLIYYRNIARLAMDHLEENGRLYLEINEYLGEEMVALLDQYAFESIELKKDMFGKDRMICARKTKLI